MLGARLTASVLLCLFATALSGCSSGGAWPTLPGLGGMGQTTLTPEEQQAKIKELANAQSAGATVQPAVLTQPAAAPAQ